MRTRRPPRRRQSRPDPQPRDGDIIAELERATQLTLPGLDMDLSAVIASLSADLKLPDLDIPIITLDDPLPEIDQVIALPALDLSAAIVAPLPRRPGRGSRRPA